MSHLGRSQVVASASALATTARCSPSRPSKKYTKSSCFSGFWSSLRTLRDDWIGSPKLSIFVSADSFVGSLIEPTAAQVNESGHIFGTLQNRSWKTTYKGDGARYVMDVHTGCVS